MISKSHFILYVNDQKTSTDFYSKLLCLEPLLNVPGMTEFKLSETTILGIMPTKGIERLLEGKVKAASAAEDEIKAELYLMVSGIESYCERAIMLGAKQLSKIEVRDWGHKAAYFLDADNYVIAFAEEIEQQQ